MNKNAIQKYAIWARNEMIEQVKQRAYQYGITDKGYGDENAAVIAGRVLSKEEKQQRYSFVVEIKKNGFKQAVEEVAYTWFNRFVALRYMEVNDYLPTHVRVFSDANGNFNPEILKDVLHLDLEGLDKAKVSELLNANKTEELYRYLLLTQCNALNALLPEMFEKMGAYTEMLLPNNILKPDGVLGRLVSDIIPEDTWRDGVQIIGWLYQYYNTEPKQAVFDGLKKNIKITKENIPAATQLFTPDWIVRYMVENSLGRLWLESHPDSPLQANWKYYLDEAEQTPEVAERLRVLRKENAIKSPEDIKVMDCCMGSGHILVYAFDVLMQIYTSEGYSERDAAKLILEKNIYGLEIDRRAYQLSYFALMMKARQFNRRILTLGVRPQVYEPTGYADGMEYGSLIRVDKLEPMPEPPKESQMTLFDGSYDTKLNTWNFRRLLAQKYDVVVTNPPYMGASGMGATMSDFVKNNYPDSKSDLFAVFIERILSLSKTGMFIGLVTSYTWMFLASYKALRLKVLKGCSIRSLVQPEYHAFFEEAYVPLCAFVLQNASTAFKGEYISLQKFYGANVQEPKLLEAVNNRHCGYRYSTAQTQFEKIEGCPFAYWLSDRFYDVLGSSDTIAQKYGNPKKGLSTGDNEAFLRCWFEVGIGSCAFALSEYTMPYKWIPINKGGEYRKWYGNNTYVIDWYNSGSRIKAFAGSVIRNEKYYFRKSLTWTMISSACLGIRLSEQGKIFEGAGPSLFPFKDENTLYILALLSTKLGIEIINIFNPTMNININDIGNFPVVVSAEDKSKVDAIATWNINYARTDWDAFETSWDFTRHPLVPSARDKHEQEKSQFSSSRMEKFGRLSWHYENWESECEARFHKLQANEEELNRIFIDIYGLQNELTPEVEDKDVTVRKADLGRDIRSLISYAVGCMFGRYSLDTDGLAYAGGDWDNSKYSSFSPDRDNILPICDDEYFDDDILGRFVDFIKTVYGAETLEENLKFIADALGGRGTPREVIRNYFLNDFYKDHCKVYQKRPIYWLFDSGKKNGFKALIYLHRYQSDLLAKLRTDYVHEQQERYRTQLSHIATALNTATGADRARLLKQQDKLTNQLKEITSFEEKVHHLADQNIDIDLDDGVKKNYEIFADVLAKI